MNKKIYFVGNGINETFEIGQKKELNLPENKKKEEKKIGKIFKAKNYQIYPVLKKTKKSFSNLRT